MTVRGGVFLLLAASASLAVCAANSQVASDTDPFVYAEAAQGVLDGRRLYGEVWQDKPPLAILAYAVPQLVARGSYLALEVFLWMVLMAQAVLLVRALGAGAPGLAAAAFTLLYPPLHGDLGWLSTEHLANVACLAILLSASRMEREGSVRPQHCLGIGLLAAVAFATRQTSLAFVGVPLVAVAASTRDWKSRWSALLWLGSGLLMGLATLIVLLWRWMDFRAFFHTVFVYPLLYAARESSTEGLFTHELFDVYAGYGLVLLLAIALFSRQRRIVIASVACGLAAVWLPRKPYPHYLASLLPAGAFLIAAVVDRLSARRAWLGEVLTAALGGALLVGSLVHVRTIRGDASNAELRRLDEVAAAISAVHVENPSILVSGEATSSSYLYFVTRNPPANAFFGGYQLDGYHQTLLPRRKDEIFDQYRRAPPGLLVFDASSFRAEPAAEWSAVTTMPRLISWLLAHRSYALVNNLHGWTIYREVER
jgi:hypothetical protein